jgi:nucleoid DNA-binding protein
MASPTAHDVIHAFAQIVRRKLVEGQSVDVPDLGRFDVKHESSTIQEQDHGETSLSPPRDVIDFDPEI